MSELLGELSSHFNTKNSLFLLAEVVVITLVTYIVHFLVKKILRKLNKRLEKSTTTYWDEVLVKSVTEPISIIIWAMGALMALSVLSKIINFEIFDYMPKIILASIMFAIAWISSNIIAELERIWQNNIKHKQGKLDPTTAGAIIKLLKISATVIILLITLDSFGVSISALVALGSASGFGISFAAKDILANYFGALMIYLDKPFRVGDWVKLPEQNVEGHIEKIGLRCTEIKTFEKRPMYIPNAIFSNTTIENPSRMSHRRIKESIFIRYQDLSLIANIVDEIRESIKNDPDIDLRQDLIVKLDSLATVGVEIAIYCYTKKVAILEYSQVKNRIMLEIANIINANEAKLVQYPHNVMPT